MGTLTTMAYTDVAHAAETLGLHPSRVRELAAAGRLPAEKLGDRWLIDEAALERWRRTSPPSRGGRPWSPAVAWAVLHLLSGDPAPLDAVPRKTRYRIRQRLAAADGLAALAGRMCNRATVERFSLHPSLRSAVLPFGAATGASAANAHGSDLVDDGHAEIYASRQVRGQLMRALPLRPSREGPVVVRWVEPTVWKPTGVAPIAAVALDLAEDPEPRAQRAAAELTMRVDAWWRG